MYENLCHLFIVLILFGQRIVLITLYFASRFVLASSVVHTTDKTIRMVNASGARVICFISVKFC